MGIEINLAPGPDHELVARTDDVVGRDRDVVRRGKGAGHVVEKAGAVNGEWMTQRRLYQLLEVGQFDLLLFNWKRKLGLRLGKFGRVCLGRGLPLLRQDRRIRIGYAGA